jgi:anti-sigma B factor antagonist
MAMSQTIPSTPQQFRVNVEEKEDRVLVRCSGRLTIENGAILRNEVHPLIKQGTHVVLDLTDVTHCDSMGLGAIISLYVSSKSAGCRLQLVNLGGRIRQLFSMANILSLFESATETSCRIP